MTQYTLVFYYFLLLDSNRLFCYSGTPLLGSDSVQNARKEIALWFPWGVAERRATSTPGSMRPKLQKLVSLIPECLKNHGNSHIVQCYMLYLEFDDWDHLQFLALLCELSFLGLHVMYACPFSYDISDGVIFHNFSQAISLNSCRFFSLNLNSSAAGMVHMDSIVIYLRFKHSNGLAFPNLMIRFVYKSPHVLDGSILLNFHKSKLPIHIQ